MKSFSDAKQRFCLSGRIFEKSYSENRLSLDDFFRCAAANGFKSVELRDSQILPGTPAPLIDKVNLLSEKYCLPVEMLTARQSPLDNEEGYRKFTGYLELAKNICCRQIKVTGTDVDLLCRAADAAAECGILLGTNNHIGTVWETCPGTLEMLARINHPNFHCHFDPSHLWLMREELSLSFMREIVRKVSYLIVQDYVEGSGTGYASMGKRVVKSTELGEYGEVGYPGIIRTMVELGFAGSLGLVFLRNGAQLDETGRQLEKHCGQISQIFS